MTTPAEPTGRSWWPDGWPAGITQRSGRPTRGPCGLADWDPVRPGPREADLIQPGAPGNRFGLTEHDRRTFSDAYGYDVTAWPGWTILRDIRELHSLAAHVRAAPTSPPAAAELQH